MFFFSALMPPVQHQHFLPKVVRGEPLVVRQVAQRREREWRTKWKPEMERKPFFIISSNIKNCRTHSTSSMGGFHHAGSVKNKNFSDNFCYSLSRQKMKFFLKKISKAALRRAFNACVYCMWLRFQSNYFVWTSQSNYFENATAAVNARWKRLSQCTFKGHSNNLFPLPVLII